MTDGAETSRDDETRLAVGAGDLLLALESSGAVGTVVVGTGAGEVRSEVRLEERRQHAARLVPAVGRALEEAGVERGDLDGVVIGEGPGSFTGVRVAAATAKGLAHALRIPLRAVSSLVAAALAGDGTDTDPAPAIRYVLFDARGDRVYGACYGIGTTRVETLVSPHAGTVRDVLAEDVPGGAVFVGDGALRHEGPIRGAGFEVEGPPRGRPTARALLRYLALHPETGPIADLAPWEPAYLRASNAERGWNG